MRNDRFFGPLTAIHCFQRSKNPPYSFVWFLPIKPLHMCEWTILAILPRLQDSYKTYTILSGHFINSACCFKRNFIASSCILVCVRTLCSLRCAFNMHVKTNFVIVYCLMFFQIYLFLIFISHSIFTPFSAIFFPSLTLIFVLQLLYSLMFFFLHFLLNLLSYTRFLVLFFSPFVFSIPNFSFTLFYCYDYMNKIN